jgi:hypothetical protein
MTLRKTSLIAFVAAALVTLAPAAAKATPGSGANANTIPFSCDGQSRTLVVESLGIFGAAYVVETGQTFVPTSFTFNGNVLSAKAGPLPQTQVTCTTTTPGGVLVVTGFLVPPSS